MRLITSALCTTAAVAFIAGCSGGTSSTTSPTMPSTTAGTQARIHGHKQKPQWEYPASVYGNTDLRIMRPGAVMIRPVPAGAGKGGIYAGEFYGTSVFGYQRKNTANNPPECSIGGVAYVNGLAVDGVGNLIEPDGGTRSVNIWQGPGMCGALAGNIADPYGQPSDASSPDAVNGTIAVGNIFDNSSASGSVSICTLAGGCTENLTNSVMYKVAGVAMDNSGNCWASAEDVSAGAHMVYFAGCTGGGQEVTGFMNADYGGLDIDNKGNIVSFSKSDASVYVYSGCNPACTLVGGPFPLQGISVFGHLNREAMTLAAADQENGTIDVYQYSPTAITYWYSISNGLAASYVPNGVAQNPRSKQ